MKKEEDEMRYDGGDTRYEVLIESARKTGDGERHKETRAGKNKHKNNEHITIRQE